MPADTPEGTRDVVLSVGGKPSNPVPVLVSRLPEVAEADADHATPAAAQTLGYAPEWVAGEGVNAQVRRAISITPEMRAFIANYVKNARR